MSSTSYLELHGLSKSYGAVKAVDDLSIDIERGELVSFIGPSGCGKTTLLRAIGGFAPQDSGNIVLDGEVIDEMPPERRPTGMVFQNYALFPHMSVQKNVEYGLKRLPISRKERRKRVDDALGQVQLDAYTSRKPAELSGGQQQRVAIARCLVRRPKLLLLDEPLSNLDAKLRIVMRDEIRRIKDELDITVLFVTHDQEEALSISDRILVLNGGVTQQVGEPSVVYNHPANEFVSNFLGFSNLMRGRLASNDGERLLFESGGVRFPITGLRTSRNNKAALVDEPGDETYTVLVRPESIRVDAESPVTGELTNIVYHGNFTRYTIRVGELSLQVEESNSDPLRGFEVGASIGVRLPSRPFMLDSDSARDADRVGSES